MTEQKKVKRVGLLGGSFNPVHMGHLILAEDAREALGLDEVWFIPCRHPAHKPPGDLAAAEDRCAMLELALAGHEHFRVSRVELDRAGVSYTVDTLRHLREANPGFDWYFIIGADTVTELHTWRAIEEVLQGCHMIHMARPGGGDPARMAERIQLPPPWPERIMAGRFEGHLIEVSSSEIRKRVAEARSIRYLVPLSVETYIREHQLYR